MLNRFLYRSVILYSIGIILTYVLGTKVESDRPKAAPTFFFSLSENLKDCSTKPSIQKYHHFTPATTLIHHTPALPYLYRTSYEITTSLSYLQFTFLSIRPTASQFRQWHFRSRTKSFFVHLRKSTANLRAHGFDEFSWLYLRCC